MPATIRRDLLHILSEGLLHSAGDSPMLQHVQSLLVSLLETGTPEELQVQALRIIQIGLDPISRHDISRLLSGRESDRSSLTPQVINATLLRFIPKHPLLCLDVLGALALKEDFRSFLATQASLLKFLVHCCQRPETTVASLDSLDSRVAPGASCGVHCTLCRYVLGDLCV